MNDALQAYSSESDRLAQLGDAVRKSRVTLAVAQSGLRAGTTEPAEVLRARRTLIASENAETGARTRTALAIVSLCRSLGGGFTLPEAQEAEQ